MEAALDAQLEARLLGSCCAALCHAALRCAALRCAACGQLCLTWWLRCAAAAACWGVLCASAWRSFCCSPAVAAPPRSRHLPALPRMRPVEPVHPCPRRAIAAATVLQVLRPLGIPLASYEGGQHFVGVGGLAWDEPLNQLLDAANRDARMRTVYLKVR